MKKKLALFSMVFFFVCSTSCSQIKKKSWSDETIVSPKYQDFAVFIDNFLTAQKFNGAVLIAKDREVVIAKGYGPCDSRDKASSPITINTTFEAGSITKQLVAAAIMQLVQAKKVRLDDKLSKYFPDYVHGEEITIQLLLNMRSGLIDYLNMPDEFFPKKVYRDIEKKAAANESIPEDIVMQYFYDAPLMTKPDSTYFYCNTNYFLLAKIIEQVTGLTYQQYMQKNILDKCGMKNSNLEYQQTQTKGYDYKGKYYGIGSGLAVGAGDLNSTIMDLYKWNLQFTSGKVVKKKSFQKMIDTESYGFGVYRKDKAIFHSGTTAVFNSYNYFDMDEKLSIIVLTNTPINKTNATFVAGKLLNYWKNRDKLDYENN